VSLVIAVIAVAFAVTRIESLRDGVLVLAGGLALAAVTGAFALTTQRRRRAMREVERYFTLSPEMVILAGFDGYWKRVNPTVEALLGYTERDWRARPFMEFVHRTTASAPRRKHAGWSPVRRFVRSRTESCARTAPTNGSSGPRRPSPRGA
jgi:PAS domain-containing protein